MVKKKNGNGKSNGHSNGNGIASRNKSLLGHNAIFTPEVMDDIHIKAELGRYRMLGMALMKTGDNSILRSLRLGLKDMTYALLGLVISIAIAIGVNDQLTVASMFSSIPEEFAKGIVKFFSRIGF